MITWQYLTENIIHVDGSIVSFVWLWTVIGLLICGQLKECKSKADVVWQMVILGPVVSALAFFVAGVCGLVEEMRGKKK